MVKVEIWNTMRHELECSKVETFDAVMQCIERIKENIEDIVIFNEFTENKVRIQTNGYFYLFRFNLKQLAKIKEYLTEINGGQIERRYY